MAITVSELNVLIKATGAKESQRAIDQVSKAVNDAGGKATVAAGGFDAFYDSVQGGAGNALASLDQVLDRVGDIGGKVMALGAGITSLLTAPVIAGSWMSWGQVDSVQQATVAMNAYADSAEQVDAVLARLLDYAQSDRGVLFQREDLFAAAQSLLMYGDAIEDVAAHTEILSLSVGLGLSNWTDLNRVIGRVGSTGRLTGEDFDYLTAAGFRLDDSLRNTDLTWEELFTHLEAGIPADAMADQVDTIRGQTIRLQSALRGLGNAFLGVDPKTSEFIEGGIGDQIVNAITSLTAILKNAAPAANMFGNAVSRMLRPVSLLLRYMATLPKPITTVLIAVTGLTGVLLTGVGAIMLITSKVALAVLAFQALGGMTAIISGLGVALTALAPAIGILTAIGIAVGALYVAYEKNFLGFRDFVDDLVDGFQSLEKVLSYLMRDESSKTFTLDITTAADASYSDWVAMPDGTLKNAELNITATGSGPAFITKMENADAPDGYDWTLNIDVTGDGVPDALKIIDSVNQGGGEYLMTATVDDTTYQIWYDEVTGQAVFVKVETDVTGAQSVADAIMATVQWALFLRSIDPYERLQGLSDGALEKLQEVADVIEAIATIVADWAWGAIVDSEAFQGILGVINSIIERLETLKGIWEWFKERPLFGADDWEPDGKGGITEPDTGTTAVPVPAAVPQDFGGVVSVTIKADDTDVREKLESVAAAVSDLDGTSSVVDVLAEDNATDVIRSVGDDARDLDGTKSTIDVLVNDQASSVLGSLAADWGRVIATSYIDVITRPSGGGVPGRATGGFVNEPLTLVGEGGPELVSLPRGSYVHTNAQSMRMMSSGQSSSGNSGSSKGDSYDFSGMFAGAVFSKTSREEMNAWAQDDFLPEIKKATASLKVGMGVSS